MNSPADVVDASYQRISFGPGSTPEWEAFRNLFVDGAVLGLRVFPTDPGVRVMTLQQYAEYQMREGLDKEGYTEIPGPRTVDAIGDVSVIRQEFTMHFAGQDPVDAVDIFSLVRREAGWHILSIISDFTPATSDASVLRPL